ncbi:hypothetical protein SBA1_410004 [Candidatus Sulfotelmatobacter kueseliae]|uniref:Uncharacterized protein n=1 Tax=Candidatus Sulfotelmatobacter kueseliae TaxID=2042962 RepID=A0A2U3KQK7_9BACT|nr:hypothetical protein SBA1_410004 [Candidatus Sulfotelmatobacter kueseliae]
MAAGVVPLQHGGRDALGTAGKMRALRGWVLTLDFRYEGKRNHGAGSGAGLSLPAARGDRAGGHAQLAGPRAGSTAGGRG